MWSLRGIDCLTNERMDQELSKNWTSWENLISAIRYEVHQAELMGMIKCFKWFVLKRRMFLSNLWCHTINVTLTGQDKTKVLSEDIVSALFLTVVSRQDLAEGQVGQCPANISSVFRSYHRKSSRLRRLGDRLVSFQRPWALGSIVAPCDSF